MSLQSAVDALVSKGNRESEPRDVTAELHPGLPVRRVARSSLTTASQRLGRAAGAPAVNANEASRHTAADTILGDVDLKNEGSIMGGGEPEL